MRAEIIAVGTEILLGQIVNSDAQYLSRQLSELGIDVFYHHVVGDNKGRLIELIKSIMERTDIIITTGGLGPTADDITKEAIAQALGLDMELDKDSLGRIGCYFKKVHRNMTLNNKKQAYFPKGSIIFKNDRGTAPGCAIEAGDKSIIILPGPPRELNHMYENYVRPYLIKKTGWIIKSNMLKVIGIGEAELESILMDLIEKQGNPTIATYASSGEVMVRVTAKAETDEQAETLLKPVVENIYDRIGDYIYSKDGQTLQEHIVDKLTTMNLKLSIAESCTGGMLSSMIVDIPGASHVLDNCIVSYSNTVKQNILGVNALTIEKYGAVSRETAREMAKASYKASDADISLSITGIAGDKIRYSSKPQGLVYICLYDGTDYCDLKLNLGGDRNYNRRIACMRAMDLLRKHLYHYNK